uniref:SH3 domain-containing protein 19 isoform X1 n=1 Tax=Gasterosteus aculeatus aculeatus TaxID=481459 RepID=UPI001A97F4CC|nr:SH3 domain-containing protein 19 isoform X1 [Gasterosteus aculeatus aculeatus]
MAEARREDEEEEEGERTDLRGVPYRKQATAHPERTKADHSSRGPLNSIRAAIKRTSTKSQSDGTRERSRPEITILSAQPLASNKWFSGNPTVFPRPPQPGWSAGIQAGPQVVLVGDCFQSVIREKTQEEHVVKPTAAPRRTACTATSATQTDPVWEDTCAAAPQSLRKRPAGKKPQKPPRPSPPKPVDRGPVGTNTRLPANAEEPSDAQSDVKQPHRSGSTRGGSVTVHWDFPPSFAASETAPSSPGPEPPRRPVPLPRTKSRKQAVVHEVKVQTLVELNEPCASVRSDPEEVTSCKYLKDLLEVFAANECQENSGDANQSEEASQGEDAGVKMNGNLSQRNIRARIQAFETQATTEEGNAAELAQPESAPRKAPSKPPVAAKPSVSLKPQLNNNVDYRNASFRNAPKVPVPSPGPVKEELETLFNNRSRPSVLTRENSIHGEGVAPVPPSPAVKSFKEALKPNFNINNHNSTSMATEDLYSDISSNHIPFKPQHSVDINGGSSTRQSLTRRPTTIRVPSQTGSPYSEDSSPPLPAQKPKGSPNPQRINKPSQTPAFPRQESFTFGQEPSLPPRRLTTSKTLPPRPPLAKTGPGRPAPPITQAIGRSQSLYSETPPKPQIQQTQRKRSVVPPRPNPGHSLYNKYTLQLPHGIAAFDYNGNNAGELSFQKNEVLLLLDEIDHNTFQCQVGETRGGVQKSHMMVITPLSSSSSSDAAPPQDAGSGDAGSELKVQATHDFNPEGPGELGLRAGDVVTMVEQLDSQWYRGTCRGSTGFFPINYVKVLTNSPKPPREQKARPSSTTVSGPRCVAKFDFEGNTSEDELSFSEGDVIQLKAYIGEEWARGQIGASTGLVPLNFVEIIEDLPPPTSLQKRHSIGIPMPAGMASSASTRAGVAEPARPGVEWATALYDYAEDSDGDLSFKQGDRILISRHVDAEWSFGRVGGREGVFPRAFVESDAAGQQSGAAAGSRGRAMFDFTPECDEELSLQAGDIITGLETVDEEWFLGNLRGKRALVPRNYVQVLE